MDPEERSSRTRGDRAGPSPSRRQELPPVPRDPREQEQEGQQQQQQHRHHHFHHHGYRRSVSGQAPPAASASASASASTSTSSSSLRRRSLQPHSSPSLSQAAPPPPPPPPPSSSSSPDMHSLPAVAQLLNARKVYRAGYLYRLDYPNTPSNAPSSPSFHNKLSSSASLSSSPARRGGPGAGAAAAAAPPHAAPASTATSPPNHQNAHLQQQHGRFVRYYMRLEDCILCLWSDEGLKYAQSQGTVIHPISMNLSDGFVALANQSDEWIAKCAEAAAPTDYCFVLNTAGSKAIMFCCDDEVELRRWINAIRLAIWERGRLENLYTATRLGIFEQHLRQPIRSSLSLTAHETGGAARVGRSEGVMEVRLPGDTEWKRFWAVLTEPGNYSAAKKAAAAKANTTTNGGGGKDGSAAQTTQPPKEKKRRSFLGGLLSSSSSRNEMAASTTRNQDLPQPPPPYDSPVAESYNYQLEDPSIGPTFALFGILSPIPGQPTSPTHPAHLPSHARNASSLSSSRRGLSSSTGGSVGGGADRHGAKEQQQNAVYTGPLKLTRRPVLIVDNVYDVNAIWPESEALVEHSKLFKVFGRVLWFEQEILAYRGAPQGEVASPSAPPTSNGQDQPPTRLSRSLGPSSNASGATSPLAGLEELLFNRNRNAGKGNNENSLLLMLPDLPAASMASSSSTSTSPPSGAGRHHGSTAHPNPLVSGVGSAVRNYYREDTGKQLLSWILGFYDAFRLHGRPERMIYDYRHPASPYFCQPIGQARGRLYFDPELIEDLPSMQENRPREISATFMRILVERMHKTGQLTGPPPRWLGVTSSAAPLQTRPASGSSTPPIGQPPSNRNTPPSHTPPPHMSATGRSLDLGASSSSSTGQTDNSARQASRSSYTSSPTPPVLPPVVGNGGGGESESSDLVTRQDGRQEASAGFSSGRPYISGQEDNLDGPRTRGGKGLDSALMPPLKTTHSQTSQVSTHATNASTATSTTGGSSVTDEAVLARGRDAQTTPLPYMTPPLASHNQLDGRDVRDDDVQESMTTSLPAEFDRSDQTHDLSQPPLQHFASRQTTSRDQPTPSASAFLPQTQQQGMAKDRSSSPKHPTVLRPRSAESPNRSRVRTSLDEIHNRSGASSVADMYSHDSSPSQYPESAAAAAAAAPATTRDGIPLSSARQPSIPVVRVPSSGEQSNVGSSAAGSVHYYNQYPHTHRSTTPSGQSHLDSAVSVRSERVGDPASQQDSTNDTPRNGGFGTGSSASMDRNEGESATSSAVGYARSADYPQPEYLTAQQTPRSTGIPIETSSGGQRRSSRSLDPASSLQLASPSSREGSVLSGDEAGALYSITLPSQAMMADKNEGGGGAGSVPSEVKTTAPLLVKEKSVPAVRRDDESKQRTSSVGGRGATVPGQQAVVAEVSRLIQQRAGGGGMARGAGAGEAHRPEGIQEGYGAATRMNTWDTSYSSRSTASPRGGEEDAGSRGWRSDGPDMYETTTTMSPDTDPIHHLPSAPSTRQSTMDDSSRAAILDDGRSVTPNNDTSTDPTPTPTSALPLSAAPTSASAYSQRGDTLIEGHPAIQQFRDKERDSSSHDNPNVSSTMTDATRRPDVATSVHPLASQLEPVQPERPNTDASDHRHQEAQQGRDGAQRAARASHASTSSHASHSTTAAAVPDDYIAGLNYLALTSKDEELTPAQTSSTSPPIRPPRSPRLPGENRPSISIVTDNNNSSSSSKNKDGMRQSESAAQAANGGTTPRTSVASPTLSTSHGSSHAADPLSPDPYGTYTDANPSLPQTKYSSGGPGSTSQNAPHRRTSGNAASQHRQPSPTRKSSSMNPETAGRKPGRKGVPGGQRTGKRLGAWSSDEEDSDASRQSGSDDDGSQDEGDARRGGSRTEPPAQQQAFMPQAHQNETGHGHLRESTSSSTTSPRRQLPQPPGPSTDPYINRDSAVSPLPVQATSPPLQPVPGEPHHSMHGGDRHDPYDENRGYPHHHQQPHYAGSHVGGMSVYGGGGGGLSADPRASMYSMTGGSTIQPWQQQQYQQQQQQSSPGSHGPPPIPAAQQVPYRQSFVGPSHPAGSHGRSGSGTPNQDQFPNNTMIGTITSDPNNVSAADGKALREAAVAPYGLLQAGIQQQQQKSAAQIEREAKETGGPLVALEHKQKDPSGGLVGAIASHERDRKREGGLGATLTERERERRNAEARQRELDQQMMTYGQQRQAGLGAPGGNAFGGMPQFGMPGFGAPQMPGFATGFPMDPMQMQQQMAMLAAQNAYLQAMASFNNPGATGFMSPQQQFSPQAMGGGYGSPMSPPSQFHSQYPQSYMGGVQQQPPHPTAGRNDNDEHEHTTSATPPQNQSFRTANSYFRS